MIRCVSLIYRRNRLDNCALNIYNYGAIESGPIAQSVRAAGS